MGTEGGPLAGIRVLELGTMVAGPVAATLLGDLGAEVIKVEQPDGGDPIRKSGPMIDGTSLYYRVENRNKKSVTLNLNDTKSQEAILDLVEKSDVLIENFRAGTLERWNLGYERLRERNPRLIVLRVSGFGQFGPNAKLAAYDRIALAFSGLLNLCGYEDRPPVRPGIAIADYLTAIFGAYSVMVALYHRDAHGGEGQELDVAMFETVFRFTDIMVPAYDKLGLVRQRSGNTHYAAAPGDHYETADGRYLVLTVSGDSVFVKLCNALDRPELASDPRFVDNNTRAEHRAIIEPIVADWVRSQPVEQVIGRLEKEGVPHALIFTAEDIVKDPHYAARNTIVQVEHPGLGPLSMPTSLPRMSGTPAPEIRPAPDLGQNNKEILGDFLGYSEEKIKEIQNSISLVS